MIKMSLERFFNGPQLELVLPEEKIKIPHSLSKEARVTFLQLIHHISVYILDGALEHAIDIRHDDEIQVEDLKSMLDEPIQVSVR